jgi:leucyl aminopeptidase (aminopeptidase T)
VNLAEMTAEMIRLSRLLDDGIKAMTQYAREYADAEDAYRMARAREHAKTEGTVDERRAAVDLATSKERRSAHYAEAMKQAAVEAVRARRAQLSAWQTLASAHRAEAELAKYGPEVAA